MIGLLHPGAMGAQLGRLCRDDVVWCRAGRSPATERRATEASLVGVDTLAELVERSSIIVSVCPPDAALNTARAVAEAGFAGVYADVNAIAPATARQISALFDQSVDGGIIGPPPHRHGTTRVYVCGERAGDVAALWRDTAADFRVIDAPIGAASALKMAYAGWTKGTSALLLAIRALARAEGVEAALVDEWALSQPGLGARSEQGSSVPKAWRFSGEMREIAETFAAHGLPDGFHLAAADVYERLAEFRDREPPPPVDVVLAALMGAPE